MFSNFSILVLHYSGFRTFLYFDLAIVNSIGYHLENEYVYYILLMYYIFYLCLDRGN